ncbi:MAG: lipopolysaccharide biosynthesis protein, partial [Bacteroidaceae bacterium]
MAGLKSLLKDSLIYGVSSIMGRFLNYLLVPLYTFKLQADTGGYGIIINLYAFTALLLVILTYGMETGYFRYATKSGKDPNVVYSTILISVGTSSLLFVALCTFFLTPINQLLGYTQHPEFVWMMAFVVAMDSFQCIPFARLRQQNKALRFVKAKCLFIIPSIALNLFFFLGCPWLMVHAPSTVDWFYNPTYGAGYAFVANLICTSLQMLVLLPELRGFKYRFDYTLWKEMLCYCSPILLLGIAGILNQTVDKLLYPFLFSDKKEAVVQLGIYGAATKIAMILGLLTQAFRYAYEPFVFNASKEDAKNSHRMYSEAMKYFVVFGLFAFLVVMFYLDVLKYLIAPSYWGGLKVVPIVMAGALLMGVYFNLSFWYKLTDETRWGAYFSMAGCVVVIGMNFLLVPTYGYIASAWAGFTGYAIC